MMVGVRSSLLTALRCAGTLSSAFAHANLRNTLDSDTGHFMTLFSAIFSADRTSLRYCNAGHDAPLWFRPSSNLFLDVPLVTNIPLGIKKDTLYNSQQIEGIQGGDILVFGTDGIWEAFNTENEAFDIARLEQSIRTHFHLTATEMGAALQSDILNFIGDKHQDDDITAIVVKVL